MGISSVPSLKEKLGMSVRTKGSTSKGAGSMGKAGRLTKDKFGYGMPVDAPLYPKPPIYYKNVEVVSFTYETDEEAAADILPEGLELTTPATASVLFIRYPFSTLGPYEEAILGIACTYQGEPKFYIAHIVLNTDSPLAAGREIWGYPKKLAHITLEKEGDLICCTMERPKGNRICTGVMRPEVPVPAEEAGRGGTMSLRVIPSPEEGAEPSLAELIEVPVKRTLIEAWAGPGFVEFNSTSTIDPWYKISVKQMLSATYQRLDNILDYGKIVRRY